MRALWQVNKAAAAEIAKLPQVFDNKSAVVGFKWALDAGTGVQAGMLVLDGALSMFLAKTPGVVAPLQPRLRTLAWRRCCVSSV